MKLDRWEFDVEFILLKDLPGIKKGTRYRRTNLCSNANFVPVDKEDNCIGYSLSDSLMRTEPKWFKVVSPLKIRKQNIEL